MATREEIRKVIDDYTDDRCLYPDRSCESHGLSNAGFKGFCISVDGSYQCLMQRLDGLGVVIKVERETMASICGYCEFLDHCKEEYPECNEFKLEAGYGVFEPLIEG